MTEISELLRQALTDKGTSQREFANFLDIDPSNVSKWMTGKAEPDPTRWREIEDFLALAPNSIATTAGYVVVTPGDQDGADAEPLAPTYIRAARDLSELDPEDRKAILHMIETLRNK